MKRFSRYFLPLIVINIVGFLLGSGAANIVSFTGGALDNRAQQDVQAVFIVEICNGNSGEMLILPGTPSGGSKMIIVLSYHIRSS